MGYLINESGDKLISGNQNDKEPETGLRFR